MDREKERNSVSGTERGRGQNIKREENNIEIGRKRRHRERWLFLFWGKNKSRYAHSKKPFIQYSGNLET